MNSLWTAAAKVPGEYRAEGVIDEGLTREEPAPREEPEPRRESAPHEDPVPRGEPVPGRETATPRSQVPVYAFHRPVRALAIRSG